MARTVQKIEEDDKNKADLGVDEALEDIEIGATSKEVSTEPTPEEVAADLKKQLADRDAELAKERALRKDAETNSGNAAGAANTARLSQLAMQEQAINDRKAAASTKLESVKQQLKQAKSAGDGDAEVDLQDEMAKARYELNAAEWEKGNFDRYKEAQKTAPIQTAPTSKYTSAEQSWLDKHPLFYSDKKYSRTVKLLAQEALEEGHKQDSASFFAFVEAGLEEGGYVLDEPLSGAGDDTRMNGKSVSTSVGAAPSRSGSTTAPIVRADPKYPFIPKGFTIPKDWVEAATDQGFEDPREYANLRLEDLEKDKSRQ